ncbi:hypothetical protein BO70DRAFT_429214 [Aspergillus heteromorphus CBS 117.55]|uniref:Aminoglycoside phosphotransferase domain-containing protein n=1 Tax=Aspergillus heteromorphus CBS 117.55 TaxID=1448321 RepID=A0A317W6Y7_9EURO|nr:uncharacterized protein BO70DRAFT_429214 [Aspergillus heteromorphus CBS 117.55]PWY82153.1 hypothetical protein BO70DRAFT_429214 [Aspergillus heteromorphus CBS 117.55]
MFQPKRTFSTKEMMCQEHQRIGIPLKTDGLSINTPLYDPTSRDPQTTSPLDPSTDISTIPDETLLDLLGSAPVLYDISGARVIRISRTLIPKSGAYTRPGEAALLDFVRENPSIPVPKVHRVINIESGNGYYRPECVIAMDFIEGLPVEEIWDTSSDTQREDTISQVTSMIYPVGMDVATTLVMDRFRAPLSPDLLLEKITSHERLWRSFSGIMCGLTTAQFT